MFRMLIQHVLQEHPNCCFASVLTFSSYLLACFLQGGMCNALEEAKTATDTGYWPLYRFNPAVTEDASHHRFTLDAKKLKGEVEEILSSENRFSILARKAPETAQQLHHDMDVAVHERMERMKRVAAGHVASPPHVHAPHPSDKQQ